MVKIGKDTEKGGREGESHIHTRKGRQPHSTTRGRRVGCVVGDNGTHTHIHLYTHISNIPGEAIFLAVAASSLLYFSRDMRMLKASTVAKAATRAPMVMKRRAMLY
jgi:hypothetical protein